MDNEAAAKTLEAISASALALAAELRRVADPGPAGAVSPQDEADPLGDQPGSLPVEADPLGDQAEVCLDGLAGVARMEARLAAVKVNLVAGYAEAEEAMTPPGASVQDQTVRRMSMTAEVAGALTVSEGSAERLLVESAALTTDRPLALAALGSGKLSWQHVRIMCEETDGLSPEAAAAFEAHFLDPDAPGYARGCPAGELTPGRFRAKARYWRERHHPVSIETRHTKSVKDRRLEYAPDRDGMAWFSAYLPADQAAGIWNRTTAAARAMQGPTESRTLTQLRVDAFATWLLTAGHPVDGAVDGPPPDVLPADSTPAREMPAGDAPAGDPLAGGVPSGLMPAGDALAGGVPSPTAQVLVTVPVFSMLGLSDEPATLDGYGPIPPSMARRLVADGATSFHRVLTDPRDGAPLEIGRTSYRLTKPMRQWLRLRDAKCTFPNCNNHSLDNEADHILAWAAGGGTGVANLGQPCPKHHRLKHATAWRPVGATRDKPPGWISPSGRSYPAEYQDWEPPTWPEAPPAQDMPEVPNWHDPDGFVDPDDIVDPDDFDSSGSSFPVDPWPDWAAYIAA
ncbi:DUF222 domain-containing protein [Arthrobacter sp. UC242_113]|uniref:HNH endonuclease signature motif containing protein n=1 Tax=Arthrobacter sp. UC242_113 TaxID=3374550 RepID=UPI003756D907